MFNNLDDIYRQYKNGHPSHKKSQQKQIFDDVTEPLFDGDINNDADIRVCPKCQSFNVSVDLSTNKTICNNCQTEVNSPNKINIQSHIERMKNEELKEIDNALKLGHNFL